MSLPAEDPQLGPRARWRRWAGRLLFVVGGLIAAELVVRCALWARGESYSAGAARSAVAAHYLALEGGVKRAQGGGANRAQGAGANRAQGAQREAIAGNMIQPFIGWWAGDLKHRIEMAYGEGAAARRPGNGRRFEIWLLGGSVAVNFGRRDGGRRVLLEAIATDPRFEGQVDDVRLLRMQNFAHAAHKQPQQLALVSFLLALGLVPDAIINLDGFNEVAVASSNVRLGSHPIYPALAQWGTLARNPISDPQQFDSLVDLWLARRRVVRLAELMLDLGLYRSACLGRVGLGLIRRGRSQWSTARREYERKSLNAHADPVLRGPPIKPDLAQDAMIRAWYESSAALQSICQGRGIPYLHVLQPTLHDPGAKPWTDAERKSSACSDEWSEGVSFGYPRLRASGQRLHDERGVAFFDASMVFADVAETLYYDACHFNDAGNRILAAAVAEAFLEIYGD